MAPWVTAAATLLIVGSRYVAQLRPLWARIPERWRWVPPAIVAAAGAAAQAFPSLAGQSVPELDVAVLVALAAMAGAHGPSEPPPAPPTGSTGATSAVLLLALLLPGCGGSVADPCSTVGYAAVDTLCQELAVAAARSCVTANITLAECPEWIGARGYCRERFDAQEAKCQRRR